MSNEAYFDKKIGILGGGQLGKMLCQAAMPLHLNIHILDKESSMPAASYASFHQGDFTNYDDVLEFGREMDIITIEIEKVNLEALIELENLGKTVIPSSSVVRTIRDKGLQKRFYSEHDFPTSAYELYDDRHAVWSGIMSGDITYPFVQKARRGGYDGRGVAVIRSEEDLPKLIDTPSVVEELVDIEKEISIIVARNQRGEMTTFPAVEMEFEPEANLVKFLFSPATVDQEMLAEASTLCKSVAEKMDMTGLLAVELFLDKTGKWLINEAAPRPHNSGHHTIEGCNCSQFDLHIRCLLDLAMPTILLHNSVAMINVLGAPGYQGKPLIEGFDELSKMENVYWHWYGKSETRPMRKMGHITVLADTIDDIKKQYITINNLIKIKA